MRGRALPRWKRALFVGLLSALALVGIEALAWTAGSVAFGARFSRDRLQAHRAGLVSSRGRIADVQPWMQDEILHPYIGFVPLPRAETGRFGVAREIPSPGPAGVDPVVVAVVGGSFAHQFAEEGLPRLIDRLRELPAFRGKAFTALNAAAGGHKEPQQLMTVAYLLALGQRLDILINLDGFNDVTLYPTENASARVFPAYPRRWHQRVSGILSREQFRAMLDRVGLEDRRTSLARSFSSLPWRVLGSANLIYLVLDARAERQLAAADQRMLSAEHRAAAPIVATGPPVQFSSEPEMLAQLVDLWRRSSQVMHDVVGGQGAHYYHFLQPNQYVPASKPMDAAEKRDALQPGVAYARIIETTYPRLREAGAALRAHGVRFEDLSDVFATHPEPLYIDHCCHVNQRGNLIVADRIFETIANDLLRRSTSP